MQLNTSLISALTYSDDSVSSGTTYFYVATSVDASDDREHSFEPSDGRSSLIQEQFSGNMQSNSRNPRNQRTAVGLRHCAPRLFGDGDFGSTLIAFCNSAFARAESLSF